MRDKHELHALLVPIMSKARFIHDAVASGDRATMERYQYMTELIRNNVDPHDTVLDVGCQDGWFTTSLGTLGYITTGIDTMPRFIEHARRMNTSDNTRFIEGFAESYTFDEMFGCIVMGEVLEHVFNVPELLENIVRFSKLDCFWLITVPATKYKVSEFNPSNIEGGGTTHIRTFNTPLLEKYLKPYGNFKYERKERNFFVYGKVAYHGTS